MDPQGEWHLAPAYDMTFAHDQKNLWLKQHQMSINGKRLDILRAGLFVVAKDMNIKKALVIIDEVVAGVKTWKKCANASENASRPDHSHREVVAEQTLISSDQRVDRSLRIMKLNIAWHEKHPMPLKATFEQRVKLHLAH